MRTYLRVAVIVPLVLLVALTASVAFAPNPKAAKYVCLCILQGGQAGPHLRATETGLVFGGGAHWFRREGETLRLYLRGRGSSLPKQLAEKDGWYLSGDYSVDPPRVVLTKDYTQYSSWVFVDVKDPNFRDWDEAFTAQIQNRNDKGKEAWLDVVQDGEVSRPGLSFKNKTAFVVRDANGGK